MGSHHLGVQDMESAFKITQPLMQLHIPLYFTDTLPLIGHSEI